METLLYHTMDKTGNDAMELNRPQNQLPRVIAVLRQILNDPDPLVATKYSIIHALCDECGEE